MSNFGEQFLHQKDSNLHTSQAVEHEKERKELADLETSSKPADKIADWLQVLEKTHLGHRDDERVFERIKDYYHREHVIKAEDVPESAFLLEQRIAREQGHGTIEITDEFRERKIKQIISDQESSLDKWLNYLSSADAKYPTWAKYWSFSSVLEMGKFQKKADEEGEESASFQKRDKDTVAAFPPLNPRALAMTISVLSAKLEEQTKAKKDRKEVANESKKLDDLEFKNLLFSESFSKIYAQFLLEMPEYSTEKLEETRGKWIKYEQGSDPKALVDSLDGYPLEWCTAGIDTARTQLEGGDFHVYYSINEAGEAVIPRLAIRMEGNNIAEVRGIAQGQNTDPYIVDVAKEKLTEFPDGKAYEQKAADMKFLTQIENKTKLGQECTKQELSFLYEIDNTIQGFGEDSDPRIKEIQAQRNTREDMSVIFDCTQSEVVTNTAEINENTKAYLGPWSPEVFEVIKNYPNITHLYEEFPAKKIFMQTLETDSSINSPEKARQVIRENKMGLWGYAQDMLEKTEFSQNQETYNLVRFSLEQLGFSNRATIDEIYARAKELGLELCPAEVGPHLILQYSGKAGFSIAMKKIVDSNGDSVIFYLPNTHDRKLGLSGVVYDGVWSAGDRFVFVWRKPDSLAA